VSGISFELESVQRPRQHFKLGVLLVAK
jgi:hypothetical protein